MKAYILDSVERFKRFSQKLDVQAVICNKSWKVFNDECVVEIYVFKDDGTMIISHDGKVTDCSWEYLPATESLVIRTSSDKFMLKPSFIFGQIFALQLYGVEQYAFLIEENNAENFQPKTLAELNGYIHKIVEKAEKAEKEAKELERQEAKVLAEKEAKEKARREEFIRLRKNLDEQFEVVWPKYRERKKWLAIIISLCVFSVIEVIYGVIAVEHTAPVFTFLVVTISCIILTTICAGNAKEDACCSFYQENGLPEEYW